MEGVKYRAETRANNQKLTILEGETLENWIILLDKRGVAPRLNTVREAANLLLEGREDSPNIVVGEK
jgi:hypothetical protein